MTTAHHGHDRPPIRALPKLIGTALGHLWASDVNAAAVELLAPNPGDHVIDLGAGFGPATVPLAKRVAPSGSVTAIDPSRTMRIILSARTRFARGSGIRIVDGTAESLPLPDQSVDAILSLNAMHHMDDLEHAASECARVLRPGGTCLLIDEDFDHPDHSLHQADGRAQDTSCAVDPEHVAALLVDAGLGDATARTDTIGNEPAFVVTAQKPTDTEGT